MLLQAFYEEDDQLYEIVPYNLACFLNYRRVIFILAVWTKFFTRRHQSIYNCRSDARWDWRQRRSNLRLLIFWVAILSLYEGAADHCVMDQQTDGPTDRRKLVSTFNFSVERFIPCMQSLQSSSSRGKLLFSSHNIRINVMIHLANWHFVVIFVSETKNS